MKKKKDQETMCLFFTVVVIPPRVHRGGKVKMVLRISQIKQNKKNPFYWGSWLRQLSV